jgi:hypothetical protein
MLMATVMHVHELSICYWLVVGKDWRTATVSALCVFYEIRDVYKLDLLSNAKCGLTLYRRGSSIFFILVQEMPVFEVPCTVL